MHLLLPATHGRHVFLFTHLTVEVSVFIYLFILHTLVRCAAGSRTWTRYSGQHKLCAFTSILQQSARSMKHEHGAHVYEVMRAVLERST